MWLRGLRGRVVRLMGLCLILSFGAFFVCRCGCVVWSRVAHSLFVCHVLWIYLGCLARGRDPLFTRVGWWTDTRGYLLYRFFSWTMDIGVCPYPLSLNRTHVDPLTRFLPFISHTSLCTLAAEKLRYKVYMQTISHRHAFPARTIKLPQDTYPLQPSSQLPLSY
jgi:hypothetical protein